MQAHVHLKTAMRRKLLLAHVTPEILDARVHLDVRRERALHRKGAETLRALVGLFVRVNAHVADQVGRFLEFLRAVRALVVAHSADL